MSHRMSKQEYTECIDDDIKFLKEHLPDNLFKCLWTSHIIDVLRYSIDLIYDEEGCYKEPIKPQAPKKCILTDYELNIAKAAYCVQVMWDEYEGTDNFNEMVRVRVNEVIRQVLRGKQHSVEGEESSVSLEKEYKEYVEDDPVFSKLTNRNAGLVIARHFYELGVKARKEE